MPKVSSQDPPDGNARALVARAGVPVLYYRDALRDAVELSIATRGVLYILAQWMNKDGTNAYPRLVRLAASCQLRQRVVAKHLSIAVEAGYLDRTSGGHKGRTAVYRATIPLYRYDAENDRLVQPLAVVEPARRLHQCAGCDRKGCTGKHQRLNEDAAFGTQRRHGNDTKAALARSPTPITTPILLLPRTSKQSEAAASPSARSADGHGNTFNDESFGDEQLTSSETGVEPQPPPRQDESDEPDSTQAAVKDSNSRRDDLAGGGRSEAPGTTLDEEYFWTDDSEEQRLERLTDLVAKEVTLIHTGEEGADALWLEPFEENAVRAMLERGEHWRKVVNTILKQREFGYVS